MKKLLLFLVLVLGGWLVVSADYYYFDTGTSATYPFQQGCSEQLPVRVNAQQTGVAAGLLQLLLDPLAYSYDQSDVSATLATNLFIGSAQTFGAWSSNNAPSWISGSNHTLLQLDRNNGVTAYNGTNGLYGTLNNFVPGYNVSNGSVVIVYDPSNPEDTTKTTLSLGGENQINPSQQSSRLTGSYTFLQEPCVTDNNLPVFSVTVPGAGTKRSHLSGITLHLTDNAGVNGISNVPYIWTGGVWTGNPGGIISNQYGIDTGSLLLVISGNGTGRVITAGNVDVTFITPTGKTWLGDVLNYDVNINPLFDYGIEKAITITGQIADRKGNVSSAFSMTINSPVAPTLIPGSQVPAANAPFINLSAPVTLGIQDDWAGVNPSSIQVTLSGIAGTNYGPYLFSGSQLNLSGVTGQANLQDQYITLSSHEEFPTSGTIQVRVVAQDMQGSGLVATYSFTTRPGCAALACCTPVTVSTRFTGFTYNLPQLTVLGGKDTSLTGVGQSTGYLMCGTSNEGLLVYSGHGNQAGSASYLSFFEGKDLFISGSNVVAYLTGDNGDTILLVRLGNFVFKVFPGSRGVGNYANRGEIRIYTMAKTPYLTGISLDSSSTGSAVWLQNIPSGQYYIVYKGQSHLASYLSGVTITQGAQNVFDFTTGTNLYNTQLAGGQDDGFRYQIAGDLKNTAGKYDFVINGNDISTLVFGSGFTSGVSPLDPKNLDANTDIGSADISIIGFNYLSTDPYLSGSNRIFVW